MSVWGKSNVDWQQRIDFKKLREDRLARAHQMLHKYPFPKGNDPSRFKGLREQATQMRNETPYALCTGIGGVIYEYCWYMRGLERWFMDMLTDQPFCEAMIDRTLFYWKNYYSGFMDSVGDLVDIVMIGDDLAGQNGPLFSPEFYRRVVKPRQKELVQRCH